MKGQQVKMYSDSSNLCEAADRQRMADFVDACQQAVDAWDDEDMMTSDAVWHVQHTHSTYHISASARAAGEARARAKQALWEADRLL